MNKKAAKTGFILAIACSFFASGINMDAAAKKESEKNTSPGVLSFEEINRNESKIRTIKASENKISILDINSRLRIKIDKEAVKKKAADKFDIGISSTMLEEIVVISGILNIEAEILGLIGEGKGFDEQTRKKNLQTFSNKMGEMQDFIMRIPSLEAVVTEKMEESQDQAEAYKIIFSVIREEINRISIEYNQGFERLNFRLGGWISRGPAREPIHIEGFDTIQKDEFYEFPFIVPPTPAEKEKLKKYQEAAKIINEKGLSAVVNIKEHLNQYVASLEVEIKNTLDCTLKSLTDIKGKIISQAKIDFKEQFKATENIIQKIIDLLDLLQRMKKVIKELDINPGQFEQSIQLVQLMFAAIKNDISSLPGDIEKARQEIENGLKGALATLRQEIKDEIKQIKNDCLKNILAIIANVGGKVDSIVTFFKDEVIKNSLLISRQWGAALELSDKVERFSIDEIPAEGNVDMRFLGKREEGNELYFKAILETKPKQGEEKVQKVIDEKYFILFKMVFIKFKPALIFAAPLMKKAERAENGITLSDNKTFQASASYSVLFKFGNRKSVVYNRFIRIGIGINVAALDFNQDSNFEVGLGLVLSGFNDFFQAGFGRNMDLDSNYFFFGINLPIGEISLPKIDAVRSSE